MMTISHETKVDDDGWKGFSQSKHDSEINGAYSAFLAMRLLDLAASHASVT